MNATTTALRTSALALRVRMREAFDAGNDDLARARRAKAVELEREAEALEWLDHHAECVCPL